MVRPGVWHSVYYLLWTLCCSPTICFLSQFGISSDYVYHCGDLHQSYRSFLPRMATAWPIANLNTIVTVVYSSLVLKEISIRQQRTKMFAGLIMGVMGIILLVLART